jgi:hypothetical protein
MLNERLINVESTSKPKFNFDFTLIQQSVPAGDNILFRFIKDKFKIVRFAILLPY